MIHRFFARLVVVALLAASVAPLGAQVSDLGRQTLGRPYWHVFIAYAIAVGLIGGWVVSIARRLLAIERRLKKEDGE